MKRLRQIPKGFTIAEFMLASSVFSVVLLVTVTGFLQIGHLFYKGVSTTQTQALSKQVVDDIASNIQLASSVTPKTVSTTGYTFYCVGNHRYTVNIGQEKDFSAAPNNNPPAGDGTGGNFGIIKDSLDGGASCAPPCDATCPPGNIHFTNATELLGNKMRVADFNIIDKTLVTDFTNQKLYTVSITIAYGDDEVLDKLDDIKNVACKGNLSNQQFCAVESISTSVYKGY